MSIATNYRSRKVVLLFTLMSLVASLVALRPVLTSRTSASVQSSWKEDAVSQMIELEASIVDLKGKLAANPKDATLKEQLETEQRTYDALSVRMGGDRAPATGKSGSASVAQPNVPAGGLGVVPTPPTGCTPTTTLVANSTPVAIPTGPAVVTSTLLVAGAGTSLWDLNLQTVITHTFAADLDITLQSPTGTVVTLTTDNGAGNDDVFNGTVWDDQANPAGQVPYTTNNGLVTDHAYVNLTLASPLVPEEAMSAFMGEDPNGTWTITISDDLAGDGGSLNSWSLEVTTFAAAPTSAAATFTNNTPVAIPTGPAVVTSTLIVSGAGTSLCDLNLTTFLTHTFAADLDITLQSPAGTVVTLTTDNGAGNDNVFNGTVWNDQANPAGQVPYASNNGLVTDHAYVNLTLASPLVPEEAMGAFIGQDPNGTWTITISDDLAGDGGSLDSWSLDVTTCTCAATCVLFCPANITQSNDTNQCGAVVNYPAPTTTGDCGTITCSPASGSFFPVGTTTVTCTASAGPTCSFTITVNDTQPPAITCPADITAVTDQSICTQPGSPVCQVVTFAAPVATDNCPGVTVVCVPPSGTCFTVGVTTVTCTATDASGNTATCSFTITTFDVALQDDADPTKVLLWNSITGQYRFCCNGTTYTGTGKVQRQGCVFLLDHTFAADRRVLGRVDKAVHAGTASLQSPPGTQRCTIMDRNTLNDTPVCQ